jgi:hypothetical protein
MLYFALAENSVLLAKAQAAKEKEENTGGWRWCLPDFLGLNGERETGIMVYKNAELRVEDRALLRQKRRRRLGIYGDDYQVENTDQESDQEDRASLRQRKRRLQLAEGNAALEKEEEERTLRRQQRRPLRPIKTAAEGFERRRLRRGMDRHEDKHLKFLARWRREGMLIDPVPSETEVDEELERILFRNLDSRRSEERLLEYCRRTRSNHRIYSRHYDRNYGARALKRELEKVWGEEFRLPGEPSCWDPNVVSERVLRGEANALLHGEENRDRSYFRRPYPQVPSEGEEEGDGGE